MSAQRPTERLIEIIIIIIILMLFFKYITPIPPTPFVPLLQQVLSPLLVFLFLSEFV